MENKILIKYKDRIITTIDTNTPDLNGLKKFVLDEIDNNIDYDSIKCECYNDNFDTDFLTTAIANAIKEEIELLRLDKSGFEKAIEETSKQ